MFDPIFDTEEVDGSNPFGPTIAYPAVREIMPDSSVAAPTLFRGGRSPQKANGEFQY